MEASEKKRELWRVRKFYNINQNRFLDAENIELKFTRKFESSQVSSLILMSSKTDPIIFLYPPKMDLLVSNRSTCCSLEKWDVRDEENYYLIMAF